MDEHLTSLPTAAVAWATAATTPAITQIKLPMKSVIKDITIELTAGLYDQSVGAEVMATEGCVSLIDEVRLNLSGDIRRAFKGSMLYELNRIFQRGAPLQTDPAVGVANAKAFALALLFDMGLWDTLPDVERAGAGFSLRDIQAKTYLDLRNYSGDNYLEIVWKPFTSYVSGNTQANMSCTVRATPLELIGYPRISKNDQLHAELQLVGTPDMTQTKNDATTDLLRDGVYSRGVLCRVGTLAATPIITATTALSLIGLKGQFKSGPTITYKDKLPPATYQRRAGWDRNIVTPRAGSVFLDHSSDFSYGGGVDGNRMSVYQLVYDIVGTSGMTMQVGQLVARK